MTVDDIIDDVMDREGGETNDPIDRGQRTKYGISERAHPEAWRQGPPSRARAKAIYARVYVAPFDVFVNLDERVRVALIDDAVMSGVKTAIRTLQTAVGVQSDGVIGPATMAAVCRTDANRLLVKLVQRRAHRLARIIEVDHTQAKYAVGWIDRCLSLLG